MKLFGGWEIEKTASNCIPRYVVFHIYLLCQQVITWPTDQLTNTTIDLSQPCDRFTCRPTWLTSELNTICLTWHTCTKQLNIAFKWPTLSGQQLQSSVFCVIVELSIFIITSNYCSQTFYVYHRCFRFYWTLTCLTFDCINLLSVIQRVFFNILRIDLKSNNNNNDLNRVNTSDSPVLVAYDPVIDNCLVVHKVYVTS